MADQVADADEAGDQPRRAQAFVAAEQRRDEQTHPGEHQDHAAPQIGLGIQFAVVDVSESEEPMTFLKVNGEDAKLADWMPLQFMNPELSFPKKEKAVMNEGCLSFPEVRAEVRRPDVVRAKLRLLDGRDVEIETDGLLSRAIQHETDHLNGILFIDRATPAAKLSLKKKIRKMWDEYAAE